MVLKGKYKLTRLIPMSCSSNGTSSSLFNGMEGKVRRVRLWVQDSWVACIYQ